MIRTIHTNSTMDKILLSRSRATLRRSNKQKIKREIIEFINKVKLFEHNENKCFSEKNIFESNTNYSSITDWEWDNNEIYLDKSSIGKQFKKAICEALETIESLLVERFSGNSFCINLSVQYGSLRNINIRIYLNRGKAYSDTDIELYNQPVLKEILTI